MTIIEVEINLIVPYARNQKIHSKEQIQKVANSIQRFGFIQPLVLDKDNNVIIGHCRYEASILLKMKTVPCVIADKLTDDEIKALRIADNKLNESDWNMEFVNDELKGLDYELVKLTGFDDIDLGQSELDEAKEKYSKKIEIPIYETKGEKPSLETLYNIDKFLTLKADIEKSTVSDPEKEFLTFAAYRHCVLSFRDIANYYAHSNKEMQDLMEKSALIIIDFDKAIENGYVVMSEKLLDDYEVNTNYEE